MLQTNKHSFKKEERLDILSRTQNKSIFKTLLGNDNPYDEGNKFEYFNSNFPTFNYMETEKFGIIFTMKGGSSFIMNTLDSANLTVTPSTLSNDWHKVYHSVMRIEGEPVEVKGFEEFVKIVNGKSKKDLIIVTRNPVYKWFSGVYQEMEGEFHKSYAIRHLLKQKYKEETISEFLDDLSDPAFEEVSYAILKGAFESGRTVKWAHAKLYNEAYYNFLELNPKIDKSKLKIIDIDQPKGDLASLLGAYHPEILELRHTKSFATHRLTHERIFSSIVNNIINSKEPALHTEITNSLSHQYFYYLMLQKKYEKYFI